MPRRSDPLPRVRRICLAFPESAEKETWEIPTFRVREKIFAMFTHDDNGRPGLWLKAPPGVQETLVGAAPKRFFRPPYVGPKGWIGVHLAAPVDWDELAELVEESYRMTAPKRLLAWQEVSLTGARGARRSAAHGDAKHRR